MQRGEAVGRSASDISRRYYSIVLVMAMLFNRFSHDNDPQSFLENRREIWYDL